MLHYLDSSLTSSSWLVFLGVWIYGRHYVNICLLVASIAYCRSNVASTSLVPLPPLIMCILLLLIIQLLNCYWLGLILKGMARLAMSSGGTDDARSEDGSDSDAEDENEDDQMRAREIEKFA